MNQEQSSFGPALAIVIILGVMAITGLLFYKHMVKDMISSPDATVLQTPSAADQAVQDAGSDLRDQLSKDTAVDAIDSDLAATPEVDVDLSFLDQLDAELLNYEELDSLNLQL